MAKKSSSTPKAATPAASAAPTPRAKAAAPVKPATKAPAKPKAPSVTIAAAPAVRAKATAKNPAQAAKTVVRKAAPKPAPEPVIITMEDISLRAYFLSEKRRNEGLPGDSEQDWVEAERQLREEAGGARAKKRKKAAA